MEKETKFTDTVILIDALFMDFVIDDLKKNFERMHLSVLPDRKSTRLNSSHPSRSRMPSSA